MYIEVGIHDAVVVELRSGGSAIDSSLGTPRPKLDVAFGGGGCPNT